MCFSANLGRLCKKSSKVGCHFYPYFQGFCPDFQQSKTFGVLLHPPFNNTDFDDNIIGNFMVCHDRLETSSLQLFGHPEISE